MNEQHILNLARVFVLIRTKTGETLTTGILRESVQKASSTFGVELNDASKENFIRELETIFTTWIGRPHTLSDGKHIPWLPKKMAEIKWSYWNRYRIFLTEDGWEESTVNSLDDLTRDTLGLLEDPQREGTWDIRGMVVGHVQSGKTANYIGLVCRAIDAGYKVIIVLAGIHNSLRSQTQIRLDEGLLGFDSVHNLEGGAREPIGVGGISGCSPIDTITTRMEDGDFRRAIANHFNINPGGHPLLFVIKKNGSVLRNLLAWVEWAAQGQTVDGYPQVQDVPLLVIDDEADFGSVDTRRLELKDDGQVDEDHNPTVINRRIRQLLYYFQKSAYIGYTATPFANIFIFNRAHQAKYGDDLFPRSFITALPTPSNYVGPTQLFGISTDPETDIEEQEGLPIIRVVDDADEWIPPKHKSDHVPLYQGRNELPPSLRRAIRLFLLSCAARRARGQENVHNSMLIHVTRYVNVQAFVQEQVKRELTNLQQRLHYGDGDRKPTLLDELHEIWDKDFVPVTSSINDLQCPPLAWNLVESHLLGAALAIENVKQINGSTGDILDYIEHQDTGLTVIAIGGDKLSRGLTLEGLTVSYFLRTSQMYDTLMQMGRWFGYRPGYLDLCRLFTTQDLHDWFRHITLANEELRREFIHMEAIGGKPDDYGLRVRSHPNLLVTAPMKMRQGTELRISFSGDICETVVFDTQVSIIEKNFFATKELLCRLTGKGCGPHKPRQSRLGGADQQWSGYCWTEVSPDEVCRFLREFSTHKNARKVESKRLADYIEKQFKGPRNDLSHWTVYLAAGDGNEDSELTGDQIKLVKRSQRQDSDPKDYCIRRLLSPQDEAVDIGEKEWQAALDLTRKVWDADTRPNRRAALPDQPAGWALRRKRSSRNGLLLIYPLEPDATNPKLCKDGQPVIGFGVSFPYNEHDKKISYIVNPVYADQEYGDLE